MTIGALAMDTCQRTLQQLESVIERGQQTFIEVGEALAEIQERRLYRTYGYDTFENYCKDRWGWTRGHAYNLIHATEVVHNVLPIIHSTPTLTQAIQMASLPAEQQREIAERVDFSKTTVRDLREIVQEAQQRPHVSFNAGNNQWYTPPEYIETARRVLGAIDLDPASSEIANHRVKAARYFTAENDGMAHPWSGRVWMNPPYAADLIGKFADKLIQHFAAGEVVEAVVLVNNATETNWFQGMLSHASAVCFPRQRVRFLDPEGNPGAPLQGQAVLYLGDNASDFAREFGAFGKVLFG